MPPNARSALASTTALTAPESFDMSQFDWSNPARTVICTALDYVPYVAGILSELTQIFWPSSTENVWADIEDQVEALVDKQISQEVWSRVTATLDGLQAVLEHYLYAARHFATSDPDVVSEKWNAALAVFLYAGPSFKQNGYQFLLLPLYAQYTNLFLALLRDGALFGSQWGWSDDLVSTVKNDLSTAIAVHRQYVDMTYDQEYNHVSTHAPRNRWNTQPWNTVALFEIQCTLTILDFANLWKYFDVREYPQPVTPQLTRQILTPVLGEAIHGLAMSSPPSAEITQITVWGHDRIDAVEVVYPEAGGPGNQTTTRRMGGPGGTDQPPYGGSFAVADNPVVEVQVWSGFIVDEMKLVFADGSASTQMGSGYPGGNLTTWAFDGEILSSMFVPGMSRFYQSAEGIVLGFKYRNETPPAGDPLTLRRMFVAAPSQPTPEAFADQINLAGERRQALITWARDDDWTGRRDAAWALLEHRVKARGGA